MKPRIYTAGPVSGQSYEQVIARFKRQYELLTSYGYEVICPMTGKAYLRNEIEFKAQGYDNPVSTNHAIKERDRWMVGRSHVVLADFTESGPVVSIGTCMELAWADELKKHTIVVMQKDNIHRHCFILECADIVFETIEEAYVYLEDLTSGVAKL